MSKQTGSIDLKVAKELGDIATDTAQYFWFSTGGSDNGAHITEIDRTEFQNNPSGGNLLATSNGIAVRDGLTTTAEFGETVRIGREEDGYTTIYLDAGNNGAGITDVYKIIMPNGMVASDVITDDTNVTPYATVYKYCDPPYVVGSIGEITATKKTLGFISVTVAEMSSIPSGYEFSVHLRQEETRSDMGTVFVVPAFTFTKNGTSQTKTKAFVGYATVYGVTGTYTIAYNGTNSFNIKIEAQKTDTSKTETVSIDQVTVNHLSYIRPSVVLPIHRYNGDIYLNSNNFGGIFLGLDVDGNAGETMPATTGWDADLFNCIYYLGWYNDVMFGLTISESSITIDTSDDWSTNRKTIYATTVPQRAYRLISWTCSDTSVASLDIGANHDYATVISVAVGTCNVVATFEYDGVTYQRTCAVTVVSA